MLQPKQPLDPSYPSGDALRVWFLALILPTAIGNPGLLLITGIVLASIVSIGRSVMGVHYPSDVIAGIGLGFIGAGTSIWLWQILGLI
jgi:undecaprenyl-diphosphatase